MKKTVGILTALISAFVAITAVSPLGAKADTNYFLRDDFGAAPLVRTVSENMETVELNEVHKPYTKNGVGVKLKASSQGREYITYDVSGVTQAEVSAIVKQSNFGANHGWGLSLGVTDEVTNMPLNNTTNINLNNINPIYLSEDGHPFIFTENRWWCYIAGEKYSFAPSTLDIPNQLRPFTVPEEVQGVIAEDGFTIRQEGFLYPMINLEYCTEGSEEWTPMALDADNYRITAAQYLGGDKEYNVTVLIRNIPDSATKIRIGADYIRETLKPSSEGDSEADVFEDFPVRYDEAIYLTSVRLTLDEPYNGGFENLEQTGIAVDTQNARVSFAYGEAFSAEGLEFYDILGGRVREQNFDDAAFTIDADNYNAHQSGVYQINVSKGDFTTVYYVEVVRPDALVLDTSALSLTVTKGEPLNMEALIVKAKTNIGNVNNPDWREIEISADNYVIDASAINYEKSGTYVVTVQVGEGFDAVSATFEVTVNVPTSSCGGCSGSLSSGIFASIPLVGVCLLLRKKRSEHKA